MKKLLLALLLQAFPVYAAEMPPVAGNVPAAATAPLPIAVMPWQRQEGAPDFDVSRVIEHDLIRSGDFRALPRERLPSMAVDGSSAPAAMTTLRAAGVRFLIQGRYSATTLDVYVHDVANGEVLLEHRFVGDKPAMMRAMAHKASDMITERLTGHTGNASTRLAYVEVAGSGQSRQFSLILADSDGESPRVVAMSREPILSPDWSPDRRSLAFVGYNRGRSAIMVYNLADGRVRTIASENGINASPAWSPDGQHLAYALGFGGKPDIYVQNLASGKRRRLTDHPGIDVEPSWSPDGRSIVFTSDRSGRPRPYEVSVEGGDPQPLSDNLEGFRPSYSPDGKQIVMVAKDQGRFQIALLNLADGQLRYLSDGPTDEGPRFSPNGRQVVYTSRQGTSASELVIISTNALVRARLRQASEIQEPAWSSRVQ